MDQAEQFPLDIHLLFGDGKGTGLKLRVYSLLGTKIDQRLVFVLYETVRKCPFPQTLCYVQKTSSEYQLYACGNFFASLDFGKNCYSRTVSWRVYSSLTWQVTSLAQTKDYSNGFLKIEGLY